MDREVGLEEPDLIRSAEPTPAVSSLRSDPPPPQQLSSRLRIWNNDLMIYFKLCGVLVGMEDDSASVLFNSALTSLAQQCR